MQNSPIQNPKIGESPLKLAETLTRSKHFPWYQENFESRLTPECRELLENYSGIPATEVDDHVYKMRDAAWAVFPFPCIGEFWYLTLGLSNHPKYKELLKRMKAESSSSPATLIDLGTCLGQDLRKLVHDGVSVTQVLGSDVFSAFEQTGQELFKDKHRFTGRFKTADVFTINTTLPELLHSQDVVTATMFLHSFDWPTQILACKQMLNLARGAGSWVMGGLSASLEAGEHWLKPPFVPEGIKKSVYRHDRDSFIRMWEEVGTDLGMQLDIFAEYELANSEARRATEDGGGNVFGAFEQKLLWFRVIIVNH